jgi:hypothetical protein
VKVDLPSGGVLREVGCDAADVKSHGTSVITDFG